MDNLSTDSPVKVRVESDLADLIPTFVENRKKDMVLLDTLIRDRNYEEIKRMGHTLKGICAPYGFELLGELAREMEQAAKDEDPNHLSKLHSQMDFIVNNHEVIYEE